jgi:hypothetical protein
VALVEIRSTPNQSCLLGRGYRVVRAGVRFCRSLLKAVTGLVVAVRGVGPLALTS